MKINASKTSQQRNPAPRLQGRSKQVRLVLLFIGFIVAALVFFFSTLGYGAYQKQIGKTTYLRNAMDRMKDLDFSFVSHYAEGTSATFDQIDIDIKFKHLLRFEYLRAQSLKDGYIAESYKKEEFPARLTYNNETQKIKLGMTGKEARTHLRNPSKWSVQVNVKGNNTIQSMKRFSLLMPNSRGFLTDWLAHSLLNARGLVTLRTDFVEVKINGKPAGIFYLEERFDKHLIENNRLREGIIFKIEEELHPYKESKLLLNPDTRAQLLLVNQMWQDVMSGQLPPEQFFDLQKLASLFAVTDLMNNKHPLIRENIRFYFNPVTGLAEPIAREFENIDETDPNNLAMFLERPKVGSRHLWLTKDPLLRIIFNNEEFQRAYMREAALISDQKFLDDFFETNKDKIDALLKKLYRFWPFYDLPSDKLYQHQAYMRSVLYPKEDQIVANFMGRQEDKLSIQFRNQQDLPIEISHISCQDSILLYPTTAAIMPAKTTIRDDDAVRFQFHLPPDLNWSQQQVKDLKVHYNLLGLKAGEKSVWVAPFSEEIPMRRISALSTR